MDEKGLIKGEDDKNSGPSESEKDKMWEDATSELTLSFKIFHKKVGALDSKLSDFHKLSDRIDDLVVQMEKNTMTVINNKKNTYQKNELVTSEGRDKIQVNLDPIDELFDEIESSEAKSQILIFLTIPNLFVAGVICMSGYTWHTLHNIHKHRLD